MKFIREIPYENFIALNNSRESYYYQTYATLIDQAHDAGCTFIEAEIESDMYGTIKEICIIYPCKLKNVKMSINGKIIGICISLSDSDLITRHIAIEINGVIDRSIYIKHGYRSQFHYNNFSLKEIVDSTYTDLECCPCCGWPAELTIHNIILFGDDRLCSCARCKNRYDLAAIIDNIKNKMAEIV